MIAFNHTCGVLISYALGGGGLISAKKELQYGLCSSVVVSDNCTSVGNSIFGCFTSTNFTVKCFCACKSLFSRLLLSGTAFTFCSTTSDTYSTTELMTLLS